MVRVRVQGTRESSKAGVELNVDVGSHILGTNTRYDVPWYQVRRRLLG